MISTRWLTKIKRCCNHFHNNFWNSYEYLYTLNLRINRFSYPPLPPLPHTQTPFCGLLSLEWSWNVNTRSNLLWYMFLHTLLSWRGGIVPRPRQHFMSNSQWKRNLSSTLRSPNRCTPVLVKYTCECIVSKININKGIKELVHVCTKTLITIRNFYLVSMSKVRKSCCIQIL